MIRKKREKIDMDNNNNNNSGNNFFSGFLLGALVGAAIVFLFGTKKGKRLLKVISEEGLDNISNILDEVAEEEEPRKEFVQKREFAIAEKPKVRRFFRGISRRVN